MFELCLGKNVIVHRPHQNYNYDHITEADVLDTSCSHDNDDGGNDDDKS